MRAARAIKGAKLSNFHGCFIGTAARDGYSGWIYPRFAHALRAGRCSLDRSLGTRRLLGGVSIPGPGAAARRGQAACVSERRLECG
jgi:hypothetical protein